jgi:putative tricarboxylic transport membrane protein
MPRRVLAFVIAIGVNVFYILTVDFLGFIPVGTIYLAALFAVLGVRLRTAVPLALVVTLAIHYAFYKLLRVPLAWGLLQGVAW